MEFVHIFIIPAAFMVAACIAGLITGMRRTRRRIPHR